ncbi:MAG: hypothetical protein MUF81_02785 [Verrucomicrobia bacterium]|nr:hypothetical protein [Verrucomicrobiota bacterium]
MTPEYPETETVAVGVQANGNARAEIDALYTPLDEALMLLRQRQEDANLRKTVTEFHRAYPPTFLRSKPSVFLFRNIITPNHEFEHFASTARETGLPAICLEFTEDLFCSHNLEKRRLCRLVFEVRPKDFVGLRVLSHQMGRRRLCDLAVANGTTLPAFHRALLRSAFPEFEQHILDISSWFSNARREGFCYLHVLALFICDGILFENFLANDPEEQRFTRERILPSFAKAVEIFGVKPLIVPLLPRETECDERWRSHRGDLYDFAKRLLHEQP